MDLFNSTPANLLPFDGEVYYYPKVIALQKAKLYYDLLLNNISWQHDEAIMFGKHITTKRKVALYGDTNYNYHYSNTHKTALPWTKELLDLKQIVEKKCDTTFNACLLNLYHNGSEGMGWHADNEKTLGEQPTIASVSFGADRKFMLKHKESKQTISIPLEKGSLLIMAGDTQTNWLHKLPTSTLVKSPRINLTFRNIIT
ncbi:alpha-ketoglutarate-dependent dioxygenase AlkB family protein [Wenyingzhuangia sp. IMCC45533]